MKREELKEIIENEEFEIDDKLTQILNRVNAEKEEVKATLEAENANLNDQLKEANKTVRAIKKDNTDNEILQEKIKDLEASLKDKQAELSRSRIESAVDLALTKAGARNVGLTAKALDIEAVKVNDDGTISGLDEQIKKLQESEDTSFLFKSETDDVQQAKPKYEPAKGEGSVKTKTEGALLGEQIRARREQSLQAQNNLGGNNGI